MDVLTYYVGNYGPAVTRTLTGADGGTFNIQAGDTFRLRIRLRESATVMIDKLMTVDAVNDVVSYVPVVGDAPFETEGVYRAWVYYVNGKQDSDEFEILTLAHAYGEATRIGAVWRAARALEPVAWDALRGYNDYGDPELQRVIELAKLRVLPTAVTADNEVGLDARVVDYVAKKVLVDNVLSAAISFWTNQVVSQSARGNSDEVVTYPDRIRAAEQAILRYRDDLERQQPELDAIIGTSTAIYDAPAVNDTGPTLTPGLDEYLPQPLSGRWSTR